MKRVRLLGLGTLAILAISITTATTAQAANIEMLPTNAKFTFQSTAGANTVLRSLGGSVIECEKAKGTSESTSARLGTATFLFEKCSAFGFPCTGLKSGEPSGDIEVLAAIHLRHLLKTIEEKKPGIDLVVLLEHVHFTCVIILVLVLGCVASDDILTAATNGVPVDNLLLTSMFVNFLESAANSGDAINPSIDTDNSLGMEECVLLTKEGAGEKAYESSSQRGSGTITVTTGTFLIDLGTI